jgi:hypothetical protein
MAMKELLYYLEGTMKFLDDLCLLFDGFSLTTALGIRRHGFS